MLKAGRSVVLGAVACLVAASAPTFHAWASGPAAAQTQAEPRSAASYLPDGLVLVVTIRNGAGLVGGFHQLLDDYGFAETPMYAALEENPGFVQARIGVLGLAAASGTDPWTALSSVAGDEMVFGLTPGKEPEAKFIAVTTSANPAVRDKFLDQVRLATGLVRAGTPDPKRSRQIDGVTVFETENNVLHGHSGRALIASNSEALFRAALKGGGGSEGYRRAADRVPRDAAAWVYFNVEAIKAASAGEDGIQVMATNPLGGLIFGGAWRSILDSREAVAWLGLSGHGATLDLDVRSEKPLPEALHGFVRGASDGPGFDPAALPGYIGEIRVDRDWASLFAERESYLALPAAEQLVQFSNGVTTLMGQLDYIDDVLPRFSGPVYLIAARQDLSPKGYRPTPSLPAFAMVMPLKPGADADGFAKRLYSASLGAMSAVNLIATQQGQPSFVIEPDRYRDCRILTAEYDDPSGQMDGGAAMRPAGGPQGPAGEDGKPRVNIRYNFAPAVGIVGDRYVMTTSPDLLHAVIDGLLAEHPAPARAEGDALVIDGPELVTVFNDNHEELVANRMLENNRSKAEAERDVDAFLGLMKYARGLSATYRQTPDGFTGTIEVRLTDPGASMDSTTVEP